MAGLGEQVASAVVEKSMNDVIWNMWASKAIAVLLILGVLYTLYRVIIRDLRRDNIDSVQAQSLLDELARKDRQLEQKEQTIQQLVEEKADLMLKLAEIPRLREEIQSLELRIDSLVKLLDHLFLQNAVQLTPESQREVVKILAQVGLAQA